MIGNMLTGLGAAARAAGRSAAAARPDTDSPTAPDFGWEPIVLEQEPAVVVSLRTTRGFRLLICETVPGGDPSRLRARASDRAAAVPSIAQLAEELRRGSNPASGIAVADLSEEGALDLLVHDAPPAILLSPGLPARLLGDAGARRQVSDRLLPSDMLILNSASALERPSGLLGAINGRAATGSLIGHVPDFLRARPGAGATVCLRQPPRPSA